MNLCINMYLNVNTGKLFWRSYYEKICKVIIYILLCLSISLSLITCVSASENVNLEKSISPYQEVLNKLTNEFGVEFYNNPEKRNTFIK